MNFFRAFLQGFKEGHRRTRDAQPSQEPQVETITVDGGYVIVTFTDGHTMCFYPFWKGGWSLDGLESVELLNSDGKQVFGYIGLLSDTGTHERERCITTLAPGYTQQSVAAYWSAAYEEAGKLEFPRWRLAIFLIRNYGWLHLSTLEAGNAYHWDPFSETRIPPASE